MQQMDVMLSGGWEERLTPLPIENGRIPCLVSVELLTIGCYQSVRLERHEAKRDPFVFQKGGIECFAETLTMREEFQVYWEWTRSTKWRDSDGSRVGDRQSLQDVCKDKSANWQACFLSKVGDSWRKDFVPINLKSGLTLLDWNSRSANTTFADILGVNPKALKVQVGIITKEWVTPIAQSFDPMRMAFFRSLEIWQRQSTEEMRRGTLATKRGSQSITGWIGGLAHKAIEKDSSGKYRVVDTEKLIESSNLPPLSEQGILAAKKRAIELKTK